MTISPTQHRASLFAIGGTRGKNIVGKTYGIFVVAEHVGGRDDSLYVFLRCSRCGAISTAKRDQLCARAKSTTCAKCPDRASGARVINARKAAAE